MAGTPVKSVSGGVITWTLADVALLDNPASGTEMQPSTTAKTVTAVFGGVNAALTVTNPTTPLTITQEDAKMAFDESNPTAVQVSAPGGTGSFAMIVNITQTDSNPGDMTKILPANVSMTLAAVSGGSRTQTATSISAAGVATFNFTGVLVNAYGVTVTLTNTYFEADPIETVLTVYDPSLGFVTGGGWFNWPGTTDKTNFGFVMQYGKNGSTLKGSLLLIRHTADGIIRIKSNSLTPGSLVLGTTTAPMGWASFAGKCTYSVSSEGISDGTPLFKVYVEDGNNPGTGFDKFWIQVDGHASLSMSPMASSSAVTIVGGNIAVPHTPARTTKGGWLLVLATPTWMASRRKRASDSRHENQRLEG